MHDFKTARLRTFGWSTSRVHLFSIASTDFHAVLSHTVPSSSSLDDNIRDRSLIVPHLGDVATSSYVLRTSIPAISQELLFQDTPRLSRKEHCLFPLISAPQLRFRPHGPTLWFWHPRYSSLHGHGNISQLISVPPSQHSRSCRDCIYSRLTQVFCHHQSDIVGDAGVALVLTL